MAGDLRSLDPSEVAEWPANGVMHLVHDTLVEYAPAGAPDSNAIEGALAEGWVVVDGGRGYRFTLRPGLTYSDGEPIAAADFVRALDRLRAPESRSGWAGFFRDLAEVRAPDPQHVEIRLSAPDASLLMRLALPATAPVRPGHGTTGPFVVAAFQPGQSITLERNARYRDPARPYLDRVVVLLAVPGETAILQFLSGDTDLIEGLYATDWVRFSRSPAWQPLLVRAPILNLYGIALNTTRPPLDDRRVREALELAVRRDDLTRLAAGNFTLAPGPLPPLLPEHDSELEPPRYDPERARALLEQAGFAGGLTLRYTDLVDAAASRLAQSVQGDLAEVGVRLLVDPVTPATYGAVLARGDFDLLPYEWTGDFPDPSNFFQVFDSRADAVTNPARYKRPELDALLDQARSELEHSARTALYRRAERMVRDDWPWIWIGAHMSLAARQPYVMGYARGRLWRPLDVRAVWLDEPRRALP